MKGDMSKVLTFDTMLRGIENVLECWASLSSCRGRLSVNWFSGSASWRPGCPTRGECARYQDARISLSTAPLLVRWRLSHVLAIYAQVVRHTMHYVLSSTWQKVTLQNGCFALCLLLKLCWNVYFYSVCWRSTNFGKQRPQNKNDNYLHFAKHWLLKTVMLQPPSWPKHVLLVFKKHWCWTVNKT